MRYRLARQAAGNRDGRTAKAFAAASWAEAIAGWVRAAEGATV